MWGLRLIIALILLVALAVAAVPLLVLLDLAAGGTGYGMCPDGITSCTTGYFSALEMSIILIGTLFFLVALLRLTVVLARRLLNHQS